MTDVDGLVEINGNFLLLESKDSRGDPTKGQLLALQRLMDTGFFSVLILWMKDGVPIRFWFRRPGENSLIENCESWDRVIALCSQWAHRHQAKGYAAGWPA